MPISFYSFKKKRVEGKLALLGLILYNFVHLLSLSVSHIHCNVKEGREEGICMETLFLMKAAIFQRECREVVRYEYFVPIIPLFNEVAKIFSKNF